jgi:hypothetical protein
MLANELKHGVYATVIFSNLDKLEANEKETFLIEKIKEGKYFYLFLNLLAVCRSKVGWQRCEWSFNPSS